MQRRPRLAFIENVELGYKRRIKDHITGEVLDLAKIMERAKEGFYSKYHVQRLGVGRAECSLQ